MRRSIMLALFLTGFDACTQPENESEILNRDVRDNDELQELYQQDQADRSSDFDSMDWSIVNRLDSLRRVRVDELLDSNMVRTSEDYRHAAMVFQHGSDTTAARRAYDLARRSVEIDTSNSDAKWLMAAAWDRYRMRLGEPQWYGTQFVKDNQQSPWRLYDIDTTAVSDEERARLGVPALSETRSRVESMNRQDHQ